MAYENLKKELDFFIKHQDELVKKYRDKFIVLKDRKVIGAYPTMQKAYWKTQEKHSLGTFAIYHCLPGPEAYSQVFYNRNVVFR